ncbi:MAG TPA: LON peptidase substrate-binding domain-containing protein [Gaiellaceae bacterium]|nr:LON peptidase substrate-binding domain-containing protein [Gaiellaceae bacterium]
MAEIGLFPLELVLLPTERVPLHIFEDRYKELIHECLERSSTFGLVLEDEAGLRDVGTLAAVVELTHTFEDGRMNVLVEGRERFRVLQLTEGRSFRTAEVEPLPDDGEEPTETELEQAVQAFRQLATVAEADDVDEPSTASPILSFEIAARVDFGHALKQELLELRSERARLRRLGELLDHAIEALAREREVRERASGNGKVTPH